MEIIDKLPDDRFDVICDAGVELVAALMAVLQKHGLGHEHGAAVIAVAAAGIATGSHISSADVGEMMDSVSHMWREQKHNGRSGIVFDPAHRRPGFVPMERDSSKEN